MTAMARTAGKDPGAMKTRKTPLSGVTARPNPIKVPGKRTTKKSKVHVVDEIVQPPTTSVAAAVTTRGKRKSTPEGEGGSGRTQRQKTAATATTAPNPTTTDNIIDRSGTGPSGGDGGRSAGAGESGRGSGGGGRTAPSIYRYSEENETVVLSRIANIKLDEPGVVEGLLLEVGRVQDQLRVGGVGLREALRVTFGHVATSLLDSAEGMPPGVNPTFLDGRYSLPDKDAEVVLIGLMCGAHNDHVAHTGRTDNRTSLCSRQLELAVRSNEDGALLNFLYVNAYTLRCMKTGNSYSDPCATDEEVLRFSGFCRAILNGFLHAHGVTAKHLIQGLHPFLAAAVLGLIIQAYLGECTPELSEAGKKDFREVVEGMRHTSYPLGFEHPPDYVRPPSPSTDSSASTREAAKTPLAWDLKDAVLRERPSLGDDMAERLVSRIFSRPSTEEASATARAAKEANARAISENFTVSELEGVKNSGVEGTASNGMIGVESWAVYDSESLFERGADNPVLPHTWTINSLFFPSLSDLAREGLKARREAVAVDKGLRKMGREGGLTGPGDDAVYACFWSRFAGMLMVLESLFGPPPAFEATLAGALYQHGAATVVSSITGKAGAMADVKPGTLAHPAQKRTTAAGKTPLRGNVDKTATERGSTKSTNEAKADGGAASFGMSKPSDPKEHTFAPGWEGNRDDLARFRRVAGETVITHFGGKGEEQTTLLPPVGGACNHAERHVVAEEDEENEEEEEEEEEKEDDDPVELDFFVTDKEILVREMRCLVCPGQPKGSLRVSDSEKRMLEARTPPIRVVSFMAMQRAKGKKELVERPP
eukprot:g8670.t1